MSMLDDLIDNLQIIHTEVINKVIPENIIRNVTIFGVRGAASNSSLYSTVAEMEASVGHVEDDYAIVYGTTYVGTYRLDGGTWTKIGDSTQEQEIMDTLNEVLLPVEQYEGNGGTDEQIDAVLNQILGIEEV